MPVRWNEINPNKGARLTKPREIYASLQGRKWPRLRPEQNEVLEAWFDRRDEPDLVIKQNTGGGKTITGLLIAQSSLHEGIGPAIYLVPDRFLIHQVLKEAGDAKIPVTTDVYDQDFLSSRAVLVTTFHRLINGRSHFGVRGVKKVTPIGVVIVDDAHAALSASQGQFSAVIPESCPAYKSLLRLFSKDLRLQSPKAFAELEANDYGAPIRVPPKAASDRATEVMHIVRPHANDESIKTLFYSWPFAADLLDLAVITFTRHAVEIRTPCPQVGLIPAFSEARRRIYLTATLEDEGILVTELGARPDSVGRPITPKQASDVGDRLIVAPLAINPKLSDTAIHQLAHDFATGNRKGDDTLEADPVNVLVLVPSNAAAARWTSVADAILHVDDMGPTIDRLVEGDHIGVVVLVNKYDGVDLPGAACRLLIIDGVPSPLTAHEQRESAALTGSMTFKTRQVQRIEQGMGRGIRDVQDYCAVLVLTNEAALTLRDPQLRRFYSPATRAQIELSQQISEQIEGEGIEEIRDLLDLFLQREEPWVSKSAEATADVTYETAGVISPVAVARREAFDKAVAGDIDGAVSVLRRGIDTVSEDLVRGWYLEELASYQQLSNPAASQQILAAAKRLNPGVLKPAVAPPRKKVKGPAAQGTAAAAFLGQQYTDARSMQLAVGALFDNIVWGVEHAADRAEEQVRLLGLHLGFGSSRPEKEDRDGGPDNLWGLAPGRHAIIELKTDVTRPNPIIVKSEAEQVVHSLTWYSDVYGSDANPEVVLLHPSNVLSADAHVPNGTRIVTEEDLDAMRTSVKAYADELAASESWSDPGSVTEALSRNLLTAERIFNRHSRKPTGSRQSG